MNSKMPVKELDLDHFCGTNVIQNGVHFHPNGKNFVYASGCLVVIGDLLDPRYQESLSKHDDLVTAVVVSSQGRLIASGQRGDNSNVVVWDFSSRKMLFEFEEHDSMIQDIMFSHDDKILATLGDSSDGKVIFWDLSNGAIISSSARLPALTTCIQRGNFVKDIKRRDTMNYLWATGSSEGVMLWQLDPFQGNLEQIKLICDLKRTITGLSFSIDREHLYASTTSGDFLLFNIKTQRLLRAVSVNSRTGMTSILAGINDGQVITGSVDGKIRVFDMQTQTIQGDILLDSGVISIAPSPDSLEVLILTSNGTIVRCNNKTRTSIIISESHSRSLTAVSFSSSQNDRFATASLDGTLRVWDIAEYTVLAMATAIRNQEPGSYPACLVYDTMLLSGWSDGKIIAFNASTGQYIWHIDNAHADGVTAIRMSHNGRFILSGGAHGEVRLWDIRSRELITHMKEHVGKVTALVLADDDTIAVSASRDRCVLRWDLRSEKRVHCHMQRMGCINDVVLSRDEQYTITVGQERKLTYWDNRTIDPVHQMFIDGENDEARAIAISNDGKYLVTGGTAGVIRLWDYDSAKLVSERPGHSSTISCLKFSPDDKQVVSGGEDGALFIWNIF